MDAFDDFDEMQSRAEGANASLAETGSMLSAFDGELRRMRVTLGETGKDVATLERGLSRGLRRAFDGVVFDGLKLSDALATVAQSLVNTTYNAAIRPVTDHFGGLISQGVGGIVKGLLPFADGAAFSQGRVMPFADGGVVQRATTFPMRGGVTGLMGEAGPEAIMPLARGPDGKLGVRGGGGTATVVMNITTPDVQGFQRSQSQIAAQMSRALSAGDRNR